MEDWKVDAKDIIDINDDGNKYVSLNFSSV